MNREKALVKNTIILTIGKVSTQMITFFLLPLYTAILSTEEYGTVDLLNTLVSLLLPIVTFQVEQAVFRNLLDFRDNEEEKKKIISTGIFSVIFQCIIYLIIFFIISPFVHNDYKYFLATNVIAYIFASLFQQIARGLGNNTQFSIASFFSAIVTIVTNVVFLVIIKLGANGMLIGNMLGQMTCFVYLFIVLKLFKYISFKQFKYELLKKLWKYSLPLVPNALSWWVFGASDRVIVSTILGVDQNGILAISTKFSTIITSVYNIFNISWIESVSTNINDSDISSYFNKIFNITLNLFVSMGLCMIACMPFVFPIMINRNYSFAYYLIPISIISSIFNVLQGLVAVIYAAKKNTKSIAKTSVISAIINIIVHLLLINFIGLFAAVVSTLVAYITLSLYRLYDINKKYFKVSVDYKLIIGGSIMLMFLLICYYINNFYLNILSVIVAIIYTIILNRKSLNILLNMIKKRF